MPGCARGTDFGTQVLMARDGALLGQIVIADTLKEDAVPAIRQLKAQGLHTVMLTGDAEDNARHVAQETGIDEVRARLLPENKLSELQKVRSQQGSVMFVGDGINDAPVLAGADVGAAMGSGADAAIEAADVVFMNSDMSAIPQAIGIARRTRRISWQNVYFALAVKAVVMMVSHSMEDVARMTDRLLVLYGSRLIMDAPPAEVFAHAGELVNMGLDIPKVTQIFLDLKEMGLDVENVYTLEQAVRQLLRLKEGKGRA